MDIKVQDIVYKITVDAKGAASSLRSLNDGARILALQMRDLQIESSASLKQIATKYRDAAKAQTELKLSTAKNGEEVKKIVEEEKIYLQMLDAATGFLREREREQQKISTAIQKEAAAIREAEKAQASYNKELLRSGVSTKEVSTNLKELSTNLAPTKNNISTIAKTLEMSFSQAGYQLKLWNKDALQTQVTLGNISKTDADKAFRQLSTNIDKSVKSLEDGEKAAKGFGRGLNVARLAAGALVAAGLFRVINFVEESLRKATETAKEFETSLFRLSNVERILSQGGVETTFVGLQKIIADIKKDLPIFSEADITQQVSLIGIMTKELGLTEEQIGEVARAIGVLNVRSSDTEDLLTTTNKVLTALVAPSGKGIASLGLDFSQANIEAMAFKTSVLGIGETFADLTEKEKDTLKVAILLASTGQEFEAIQDYINTNVGATQELSAEWEDFLKLLGQVIIGLKATVAPTLISILEFFADGVQGAKALLVVLQAVENVFRGLVDAIEIFRRSPIEFVKNFDNFKTAIAQTFTSGLEEGFNKFFSGQIPSNAPEWFKKLFGAFENTEDTPTVLGGLSDALDDVGKEIDELDFKDLIDDLEELSRKAQEAEEDFNRSMTRMFEDNERDKERLNIDYNRRAADILRKSNTKIGDIQEKYRQEELENEAKFQEQLRQLREKFLFNLEDALRERDARQVIRLQRQYEMDKQALINENELKKKSRKEDADQALQDAIDDRDERLRLLEEERQLKLARMQEDYELERARKEEDHIREMEDLERRKNERLEQFVDSAAEELGLNEAAAQALYDKLKEYYGTGGKFEVLYNQSRSAAVRAAAELRNQVNSVIQSFAALQAVQLGMQSSLAFMPFSMAQYTGANMLEPVRSIGAQAQGGTYFADKPTHALFGEAGAEIATFTPARKISSMNGASGGGSLSLSILLSPDLEAKIIDTTLNEVSATIETISNER